MLIPISIKKVSNVALLISQSKNTFIIKPCTLNFTDGNEYNSEDLWYENIPINVKLSFEFNRTFTGTNLLFVLKDVIKFLNTYYNEEINFIPSW